LVTPSDSLPTVSPPARQRRKMLLRSLLALGVVVALSVVLWMGIGLQTAREAMSRDDLKSARAAAERYLRLFPGDSEARLLAGNAYFLDDSLPPIEAAERAISHFSRIPDNSPLGAEGRLRSGRAAFLVRQEPGRAEELLRRSIALDPDQFDAHYLLWHMYNMTERYFDSEPLFREVYRLCPPEERAFRLREWYSSQFTPLSASSQLDLLMGFRQESEVPTEEVALRRLTAFYEYEPNQPATAAALAQWHIRNQSRESALEVLQKFQDRDLARKNRYFQAAHVEALIDAGQLEKAGEEFALWSGPKTGYQYLRLAGMHAQEVQGDLANAEECFRQATATWPGPSDWLLMNRHARCLALLGKKDESMRVQAEARRVEGLTDLKVHQKIRQALGELEKPEGLAEVVKFYESFGRTWEADAWKSVLRQAQTRTDAVPPAG
jgi:tetratricopeptide (TPR) repeat protein